MANLVAFYIDEIRPLARQELAWFSRLTFQRAIEAAGLAIGQHGKFVHQYRLMRRTLEVGRNRIQAAANHIRNARTFDDLFSLIEKRVSDVWGLGELYVYDTSVRIGAHLGLLPDRVYLHAGTRVGARALGFSGRLRSLDPARLPSALRTLAPHEIEDFLCIFKAELRALAQDRAL